MGLVSHVLILFHKFYQQFHLLKFSFSSRLSMDTLDASHLSTILFIDRKQTLEYALIFQRHDFALQYHTINPHRLHF